MKLKKYGLTKVNELLEKQAVNNYHKTLLKSIKHNSKRNNLQKADIDMLKILLEKYEKRGE